MAAPKSQTSPAPIALTALSPADDGLRRRDPSPNPALDRTHRGGDGDQDPLTDVAAASRQEDSEAPDGGRDAWFVIASCFAITWWFVGVSYSWGVVQSALISEHYGLPPSAGSASDGLSPPGGNSGGFTSSTLAFVGSVVPGCIAALALVNATVIRKLGIRNTAMLGVFFLGGGWLIGGWTTDSVPGLFAAVGGLTGLGTSLCFMVVSVTPAQYFVRKRGRANGIVYAGGGLGGAVISFAMDGLIKRLGLPWTFRVVGILILATGIPAAYLLKQRAPIRKSAFVDWTLFRDPTFFTLFLAGVVATFPLFVPPFFLPLHARALRLPSSTGAALVAAFNFSSAVGRVLCGVACDSLGALNTLIAALALSALSMLAVWPAAQSAAPLVAFAIINGAANGGFFATMPTVVGNVFGSARMGVAMGMIVTGWAGGYLMGAPIAGFILQSVGGIDGGEAAFQKPIFYAGSMGLGAAGLAVFVRIKKSSKLLIRI